MNESHCIDDVQIKFLQKTEVFRFKLIVVIGVDVCYAATSRWDVVQSAVIERLQKRQYCAGRADLLHLSEQV